MAEYIEREEAMHIAFKSPFFSDALMEEMKAIPAADVAPVRHGRWGVEVGMNFFKERNCPVCKKRIESNFWNYCPNCGAKMEGGDD